MRIIAGNLGGRTFNSPQGRRTHPMSERVRGALFNVLGGIEGLRVLDAFAGSGALSFEAISRGAAQAIAIDFDKSAQTAITSNIAALGLSEQVKLIKASVSSWLSTTDEKFDIILCDPPYDALQPALLSKLGERVAEGGLLALSWPGDQYPPEFQGLTRIRQNSYGDAQLVFYRKV